MENKEALVEISKYEVEYGLDLNPIKDILKANGIDKEIKSPF